MEARRNANEVDAFFTATCPQNIDVSFVSTRAARLGLAINSDRILLYFNKQVYRSAFYLPA